MQNLAAARNLPWVLWPQTYTPIPHNLYCTCESHTRQQLSTCSYNIKHVFLRLLSGFLMPKSSTYVLGIVFLKCLSSLIPGTKGKRKKECLVSTIRACTLILGNHVTNKHLCCNNFVSQPIFPLWKMHIPLTTLCVNYNERVMKAFSSLVTRIIHVFVHSS